jgi:regulatory protein RepA
MSNNQSEKSIDSRLPVNIAACSSTPPKVRDYVLPGLMPGTVGSIVAPGATSKSMLALMLTHLVGGGIDLLKLGPHSTGPVVYLSAEDGEEILHERLHSIGTRLNLTERAMCAGRIHIEDLTQYTPDLFCEKTGPDWRNEVEKLCASSRLLLLDTLRSFHSGDENRGEDMAILVGHLRAIAARTKCAVVFLHHANKALAVSGQGDLQQAARGSSVLTDNIRWQAYLAGMSKEESEQLSNRFDMTPVGVDDRGYYVRFGICKQNYGAPFPERWFKRGDGGVLEPVTLTEIKATTKMRGRKRG